MIKQTEAQNLGRAGERWFESILPKEWIFQKPAEDIGLDGKVIIGDDRFAGGLEFGVQVKASKKWKIKNDTITLEAISKDTMKFWMSRIFPTVMVLYDATNECGYYGFLGDALHNPGHLINVPTKTMTLKFYTKYELNKDSWKNIEKAVETYYSNLVHSLYWVRNTINLFPYIHTVLKSADMLHMALSHNPTTQNEIFLKHLTITTAHKEIVNAVIVMRDKFRIEKGNPNLINKFISSYIKVVKQFIPEFEKVISTQGTFLYQIHQEIMYSETPKLLHYAIEFLKDLTSENGLEKNDLITK